MEVIMEKESNIKDITGKVLKLDEMVQYQDNSIVSRIVKKGAKGNITIFAFDEGEFLSEHTTPYDAMVLLIDGIMEIKISGKPFDVKADEMIIMPANEPHSLSAKERSKMLLVMIKD
jgi:quercetin dioxygenase-like cupin family protein